MNLCLDHVSINSRHLQEICQASGKHLQCEQSTESRIKTNDTNHVTDVTGSEFGEEEIRVWGRFKQQHADGEAQYNYFAAKRKKMDVENNWSTNVDVRLSHQCGILDQTMVMSHNEEDAEKCLQSNVLARR